MRKISWGDQLERLIESSETQVKPLLRWYGILRLAEAQPAIGRQHSLTAAPACPHILYIDDPFERVFKTEDILATTDWNPIPDTPTEVAQLPCLQHSKHKEILENLYYSLLYLRHREFTDDEFLDCPAFWKGVYKERTLRFRSVNMINTGSMLTSRANLNINARLEELRIERVVKWTSTDTDTEVLGQLLMTSFYTFQEFVYYQEFKNALNIELLARHAQMLPRSWFPDDFLSNLVAFLKSYHKKDKNMLLLGNVTRVLYFSVSRRERQLTIPDAPFLMELFSKSDFSKLKTQSSNLGLFLFALNDITTNPDSKTILQKRLNDLMTTSGYSILQDADGYGRYETLNYLKKGSYEELCSFTISYLQSIPSTASFPDFLTTIIIYKKYADHVNSIQNSLGVFNRLFYTDPTVDTHTKLVECLLQKTEDIVNMKPGEGAALIAALFGCKYQTFDRLSKQLVERVASAISVLLSQNSERGSRQLLAFITAEMFHYKQARGLDLEKTIIFRMARNLSDIIFKDDDMLALPFDFFDSLKVETSNQTDSTALQLSQSRMERSSILWSSLGKLSKVFGFLIENLACNGHMDEVVMLSHSIKSYSSHLHKSFASSKILENIYKRDDLESVWKILHGIAFSITLACKSASSLFASQDSLLLDALIILSNIHFITLHFGLDGFKLYREVLDAVYLMLENKQELTKLAFEILSERSDPTCLVFLISFVMETMDDLSNDNVEQLVKDKVFQVLREESDNLLHQVGHELVGRVLEVKKSSNRQLEEMAKDYLDILLEVTLHRHSVFFAPGFHRLMSAIRNSQQEDNQALSICVNRVIVETRRCLDKETECSPDALKLLLSSLFKLIELLPIVSSNDVEAFSEQRIKEAKTDSERRELLEALETAICQPDQINLSRRERLLRKFMPVFSEQSAGHT